MDTILIIAGILLLLAGIAGCFLPFLPGPPLAYASLLLLQVSSLKPYSAEFLGIWALVTAVVLLADYYIPVWGTKRFGGTKGGTNGATIGLILGIFLFPPFGIILGPFMGAFIGELVTGQDFQRAFRSAVGSFLGFIAGTFMKLGVCLALTFLFIRALV